MSEGICVGTERTLKTCRALYISMPSYITEAFSKIGDATVTGVGWFRDLVGILTGTEGDTPPGPKGQTPPPKTDTYGAKP